MSDMASASYSLAAVLESTAADSLAGDLQKLRGSPLDIVGEAVSRISTLCIQVLLSTALTWKADGVSLCISRPSGALLEAARILGLTDGQLAMGVEA
jgi:anti-anti-sigma regulatory factor